MLSREVVTAQAARDALVQRGSLESLTMGWSDQQVLANYYMVVEGWDEDMAHVLAGMQPGPVPAPGYIPLEAAQLPTEWVAEGITTIAGQQVIPSLAQEVVSHAPAPLAVQQTPYEAAVEYQALGGVPVDPWATLSGAIGAVGGLIGAVTGAGAGKGLQGGTVVASGRGYIVVKLPSGRQVTIQRGRRRRRYLGARRTRMDKILEMAIISSLVKGGHA